MAFCRYCGQQLPENANACPYCGRFVNGQNAPQTPPQQEVQQDTQQAAPQQDAQQEVQQVPPQQDYQGYQQNPQPNPQQGYQNYQQTPPQQGYQTYQQNPQQGYQNYQQYAPPYVTPEMDVKQNKGTAWLSYLGLLVLIPMFTKKYSDYTRFHVKQGATLCVVEFAYGILFSIILSIIPPFTFSYAYTITVNPVYTIFNTIYWIGMVVLTVFAIIGIVNSATGKRKELPLIGKIPWIANLLDKTVYKP